MSDTLNEFGNVEHDIDIAELEAALPDLTMEEIQSAADEMGVKIPDDIDGARITMLGYLNMVNGKASINITHGAPIGAPKQTNDFLGVPNVTAKNAKPETKVEKAPAAIETPAVAPAQTLVENVYTISAEFAKAFHIESGVWEEDALISAIKSAGYNRADDLAESLKITDIQATYWRNPYTNNTVMHDQADTDGRSNVDGYAVYAPAPNPADNRADDFADVDPEG